MSTIKVNSIKNTSTDDGGIAIDNTGHVQIDGQQLPTVGPLSNRNLLINSATQVNQRGTVTLTASGYGGPDRFYTYLSASSYACERSQQLDAPANSGLQHCTQLKTTTARTGTTADQYIAVGQTLEFQDIHNAIWGGHSHVTVSFWVKSSISGTFAFNINPCNTDSGLSGNRVLYHATYAISSADTWEKKTITIPLAGLTDNHGILSTAESAQIGRGLELTWPLGISSGGTRTTASTGWSTTEGRNIISSFSNNTGFLSTVNATFRLTGVQFEVGEKATPFEHRSHADELARCQRYFLDPAGVSVDASGTDFIQFNLGQTGTGSNEYIVPFSFPVTMRTSPTVTVGSNDYGAGVFNTLNPNGNGRLDATTSGTKSIWTTGCTFKCRDNSDSSHAGFRGWFYADAEL